MSEPTREQLLDFARKVLEAAIEGLDVDGGDVQDWAVSAGLLTAVVVTQECDPDDCACAEYGLPTTCYRFCDALRGQPDQQRDER
jgi:hypothetical protein